MKGSECKFVKYMEGSDKRFVIPVYQRNYDWKTENCKQLYDDLVKIIKGHRKSHFFGSLVSVYNPDGHNEEFLIIDGQQRLTTVSLLFLAMYGIYVWTNTSTQSKLSVLSRLFKLYDEDPADLVFYLRDENEVNEDEPGSRYELRRKYWTYALPIIQKAHGEDGSFSNVNPSRDNWINGFFGIGGFYLYCVANFDAARAEVVFGRGNKQENKAAFDSLYTHKAEIESALGTTLQWNRGDDIKSSKVFIQLNNVSIENETDWLQMANFHADWTKRFYDVIVPFIKQ